MPISRRHLLASSSIVAAADAARVWSAPYAAAPETTPAADASSAPPAAPPVHDLFPTQEPSLAREMVGVSHGNVARVKELLARHPSLARAAWDWGFGDWESALGAASHVGNVEIAELLLAHGARPSLFSAAMLGQLAVVRAFVEANPGVQRIPGPHGIPLLAHAKAGGERAKDVHAYLESLGDAGRGNENATLSEVELDRLVGRYRFGEGDADTFTAERVTSRGLPVQLALRRGAGGTPRNLFHLGGGAFYPAGAAAVRIRFSSESPAAALTLHDPEPETTLTARRSSA